MLHFKPFWSKRKLEPKNKINPKKVYSKVSVIRPSTKLLIKKNSFVVFVLIILSLAGYQVYKLIINSYKPGQDTFSSCRKSFTTIKVKPTYGVIINTNGEMLESIILTAPDTTGGIQKIVMNSKSWFIVYFSNFFTFTQISEMLRVSKYETGDYNFCYILDQLSLTSGVPIEYVIVKDANGSYKSTLSMSKINQMLLQLESAKSLSFNEKLLAQYLLGDGTPVPVITYTAFLEQFPNFFKIDEIAQEQAFIEVYNVTDIDGYGSVISKRWEMLGIEVSRVGNAGHEKIEGLDAVIYIKDKNKYVRTLGIIKSTFDQDKIQIREGRPTEVVTTGDIVVFLLNR